MSVNAHEIKDVELKSYSSIVDEALLLNLSHTCAEQSQEADTVIRQSYNLGVYEADYEKALEIALRGLEKLPTNFSLQANFAALLSDHAYNFKEPLKSKMTKRAHEIFEKLMQEADDQPKEVYYPFKKRILFLFWKI